MEALPWPTITAGGGGWLLFGLTAWYVIRGYQTGKTVPRSTYDDKVEEVRFKDKRIEELVGQNNILLHDIAPAITSFMEALQRAGRERP